MAYNGARKKLNGERIRETASWTSDGIGAPNLFRAWNEVGSDGLDEIERYARNELRDGNWTSLREVTATKSVRGPSLLTRLSAALHVRSVGRKHFARAVRAPVAAVHFAGEPEDRAEPRPIAASAILFASSEDCKAHGIECQQ